LLTITRISSANFLRMICLGRDLRTIQGGNTIEVSSTHRGLLSKYVLIQAHLTNVDHCIDSLRLALQCRPDLGLISFKWIKDYIRPWPDFRSYHTCRNWDDILEWARERSTSAYDQHLYIHPQLGLIDRIDGPHGDPLKLPKIEWLDT
jgi:hypothetical protein